MAWVPNTATITKGEPAQIPIIPLDKNGELLNITGATVVSVQIKKADGTTLEKTASAGFTWGAGINIGFIYVFALTADEVNDLKTLSSQDIGLKITFGSIDNYITCKKCLTILAAP